MDPRSQHLMVDFRSHLLHRHHHHLVHHTDIHIRDRFLIRNRTRARALVNRITKALTRGVVGVVMVVDEAVGTVEDSCV